MSLFEKSKAKKILVDKVQIKELVVSTMKQMAAIVGSSLGPGGRPSLIERDGLSPLISKDGMTIAKSLGVENAEANLIIEAAKEICFNTAKTAGDGTTTAIVLANALVQYGTEFLEVRPKYNPQRMTSELQDLYDQVVLPFLRENALPVKGRDALINVAKISANGDLKIAEAAVDAVLAAGEDGHVLIQENDGGSIKLETIDGFIVTTGLKDIGAIGTAFINDRANQQVKMDNGLVFLYDGTINDLKVPGAIQAAVEGTNYYGKPIVIFAHDFADVAKSAFAKTTKGGYTVVPVKTPAGGFADSRTSFLHDMAAYCGGTVFDPGTIDAFIQEEGEEGFGLFETAKVNMFESVLVSEVDEDKLDARIAEIKSILEISKNDHDRFFIKAALGRLTGGISTIWVGGTSELEAREKKARAEDAVEAVKSAIAEGVVPGGCSVHLVLSDMIMNHPDKKESWEIMSKALMGPFELLLSNCGEDFDVIYNMLLPHVTNTTKPSQTIFDAQSHKLVNAQDTGIIEPAKVCRVALGNALSVASLLITLGGVVVVPRDSGLENQLALSKQAFRDMFSGDGVGQQ